MKPLFQHGRAASFKLILTVVVSVTLMYVDQRFGHLEQLRATLSWVIAPLQYVIDAPGKLGTQARDWVTGHRQLLAENARLRDQQLILKARLQKLQTIVAENARLRELLGSSTRVGEDVIVAELVSVDLDPTRKLITLNRGSQHGLRIGQAVIDAEGVMGQLQHVGPLTATALLISDPSHAIPVQLNRTGLRGIAFGSNNPDELVLQNVAGTADLRIGDLLVTSGLGGRFPPDYPVARISRIERPPGQGFIVVTATPVALLDRSREVLVVRRLPGGPAVEPPTVEPPAEEATAAR